MKDNVNNENDKEIQKKIHEQYAVNSNETRDALITVIVALFGVIGMYGYMFAHTTLCAAKDFGQLCFIENCTTTIYTIEVLIMEATVSYVVIFIMQYLSIHEGFTRRMDQFAAHAIRVNLGFSHELLPRSFNPHGCSFHDFIPGIYKKFLLILSMIALMILGLTLLKVAYVTVWTDVTKITFAIFLTVILVTYFEKYYYLTKKYKRYRELEREFKIYQVKEVEYYTKLLCAKQKKQIM